MASANFILHQPFKKSANKNKELAKKENAEIAAEIKRRKKSGEPLDDLFNPRETSIYLFFTVDRNRRFRINADEKIKAKQWDFKEREVKGGVVGRDDINYRLSKFRGKVMKLYRGYSEDDQEHSFTKIEIEIKDAVKRDFIPANSQTNLNTYLSEYIDDMKNGIRLTKKGTKYEQGTVRIYEAMQVKFNEFQEEKHKQYDFDHINMKFYYDFIRFLVKQNLGQNTIGRHTKYLLAVMRKARKEGFHKNFEFENEDFRILSEESHSIYLTEDELTRMYELDLSKNKTLENARDVFVLGARTAQRYGDYSIIGLDNIRIIGDNIRVISLYQKKTTAYVDIPIHPQAKAILEKYNYKLPRIWDQHLNERIKKVGELAKIESNVVIEKTKGGKRIKETFKKHKLISSHTARRTGATLMYLAGIPTLDIMKITGHTTEREFLKYIKVTMEETAQSLSNHKYFK